MNVLDLFSGIGAFSLGLERAGMRTVAFCESDPFARRVLAKHWPDVPCYADVRTLTAERLRTDGIVPDVICGGFPCQDISVAGRGAGLAGARSGLWSEFARLIGEVRPRYVIVENVAALLGRGLADVLGDLAAFGFDAEWHCIPAFAIGAPHQRDRIWITAYTNGELAEHPQRDSGESRPTERNMSSGPRETLAHTKRAERWPQSEAGPRWPYWTDKGWQEASGRSANGSAHVAIAGHPRLAIGPGTLREWAHAATTGNGRWAVEPDVGRVVDGPAARVDRRKRLIGLGNSLVPDITEMIGRAILAAEANP